MGAALAIRRDLLSADDLRTLARRERKSAHRNPHAGNRQRAGRHEPDAGRAAGRPGAAGVCAMRCCASTPKGSPACAIA